MTEATAAAAATETAPVNPDPTTPPASQAGGSDSGANKTLLNGAGNDDAGTQTVPATWPEDWRERYAGKDAEDLKALKRYTAPENVWKSYKALRQKLSSGELKPVVPFPAEGSDEDKAKWRAEQGIPEAPDKYDVNIGDGVVWGENDKPLLDDFTKWAHANNYTPDQVKANLAWYHNIQQKLTDQRDQQDADFRKQAEDTLRADWGPDYRPNLNAVKNWLDTLPKGVGDALLGGRTADGRLIGDSPEILKALAQTAREINPAATMLPTGGANVQGVSTRLSELEAMIRDRRSEYYRGANADKLQEEYRTLLSVRQKLDSRAA